MSEVAGGLNYLLKEKYAIYLFNSRRDSEVNKQHKECVKIDTACRSRRGQWGHRKIQGAGVWWGQKPG